MAVGGGGELVEPGGAGAPGAGLGGHLDPAAAGAQLQRGGEVVTRARSERCAAERRGAHRVGGVLTVAGGGTVEGVLGGAAQPGPVVELGSGPPRRQAGALVVEVHCPHHRHLRIGERGQQRRGSRPRGGVRHRRAR
ncbi:MAG: hypothetical protein R2755_01910 [Acidimicrobiales bacterium]